MPPKRANGPAKAFIGRSRRPSNASEIPQGPVRQREITLRGNRFMTAHLSFKVMDDATLAETLYEIEIDMDSE